MRFQCTCSASTAKSICFCGARHIVADCIGICWRCARDSGTADRIVRRLRNCTWTHRACDAGCCRAARGTQRGFVRAGQRRRHRATTMSALTVASRSRRTAKQLQKNERAWINFTKNTEAKKGNEQEAAKEEGSQRYQKQVMRSRTMPHCHGQGQGQRQGLGRGRGLPLLLPRTFGSETTETKTNVKK